MTDCPICGATPRKVFSATLLGRYEVGYHHCTGCGLLRTDEPYWLEEAYASAIADTDCGLVARNLANARIMSVVLATAFDRDSRIIDVAGGYGLFTRLMRDRGFDCAWDDPHCRNLLAIGCEAATRDGPVAAVTAFEVLEHVHDPLRFISEVQRRFGCRNVFLSTETYQGDPPAPGRWAYYVPETGQHVSFFQEKTLRILAGRLGLAYRRLGPIHALCEPGRVPWWLPAFTGRASHLVAPLVARLRPSLTLPDYERLVSAAKISQAERKHDEKG